MVGAELQAVIIDFHYLRNKFKSKKGKKEAWAFIKLVARLMLAAYGIPSSWIILREYVAPFKAALVSLGIEGMFKRILRDLADSTETPWDDELVEKFLVEWDKL